MIVYYVVCELQKCILKIILTTMDDINTDNDVFYESKYEWIINWWTCNPIIQININKIDFRIVELSQQMIDALSLYSGDKR